MKEKIILLFICLPMLLCAQNETKEGTTEAQQELAIGQEWSSKEIGVKFLGVISDSRCPTQVTCIWPGEVKILLGIGIGEKYFEKVVTLSGMRTDLRLGKNTGVIIYDLQPYPETPKGIAPEEYCLILSVNIPE